MAREGFPKPDFEHYFKRLLVLNHHNILLSFQDGHTWLNSTDDDESSWDGGGGAYMTLRKAGIVCNSKIYGGVLEAIDTIDAALQDAGDIPLIEQFQDWMFLGVGGVDESRINKTEPGKGGLM